MKRYTSYALFLIALIGALVSCSEPHTHSFGAWETKQDATCISMGERIRECACGEYESETIAAIGHSYGEWTVAKEPTCTKNGERTRVCACGASESEPIEKAGHSYGEWQTISAPSYFDQGIEERYCSCGTDERRYVEPLAMLFRDEFDALKLDRTKWDNCTEWIRGGGLCRWDDDMAYVDGKGNLVIRAEWDEREGRVISGAVQTYKLFEGGYGYYEASIRFPVAMGTWGAFWLSVGDISGVDDSAADGVEIDVIESIYNDRGGLNAALHYDGYGDGHKQIHSGTRYDIDIYDGEFHVFAVDRSPEGYIFYIDGIEFWRATAEECDPCPELGYMILSVEAAEWAGAGKEESINSLPVEMLVDYVRVYLENPYV